MFTIKQINAWTSQLHDVRAEMANAPRGGLSIDSHDALMKALDCIARAEGFVRDITAPTPKQTSNGFSLGGSAVGTCLQDYLDVPYSRIVAVLGEPDENNTDGYKVSTEWVITFNDGTVATIYDYKQTNLYERGLPSPKTLRARDFSGWHIGGTSKRAVELVRALFK